MGFLHTALFDSAQYPTGAAAATPLFDMLFAVWIIVLGLMDYRTRRNPLWASYALVVIACLRAVLLKDPMLLSALPMFALLYMRYGNARGNKPDTTYIHGADWRAMLAIGLYYNLFDSMKILLCAAVMTAILQPYNQYCKRTGMPLTEAHTQRFFPFVFALSVAVALWQTECYRGIMI